MINKYEFKVRSFLLKAVCFLIINSSASATMSNIEINFGNFYINALSGTTTVTMPLGTYTREGTPAVGNDNGPGLMLTGMAGGCNYFTAQGYCEYFLEKDIKGVYIVLGTRRGEQQRYWNSAGALSGVLAGDIVTGDIVLDKSTFIGTYDMSRYLIARITDIYNNGYNVYLSGTLTIAKTACNISTAHDMNYTWTPLSPSQIANGSAPVKKAPITMTCVGSAVPVTVTVTSSNGYADTQQGIIKTDMANLGVKLTWAKNDLPVLLNTAIDVPASSETTQDFSINALPVTSTGNTKVNGGDFNSTVTLAFDYH